MAASGATPADGTSSEQASGGESSGKSDSNSPSSARNDSINGGRGSQAGGDKSRAEQSGQGESSGGPAKDSNGKSFNGGPNGQVGDQAGGTDPAVGRNPPKKSRGVAPLMLGALEPDLLQGRQMPGPDRATVFRAIAPRSARRDDRGALGFRVATKAGNREQCVRTENF